MKRGREIIYMVFRPLGVLKRVLSSAWCCVDWDAVVADEGKQADFSSFFVGDNF